MLKEKHTDMEELSQSLKMIGFTMVGFSLGMFITVLLHRIDIPYLKPHGWFGLLFIGVSMIFLSRRIGPVASDGNAITRTDASIAELESELAVKKLNASPICDGKGLPAVICRMRREGKNEKEIAQYLSDKGDQGCSNPQIGALVHPTAGIGITTSDAMTKYAQRLLDKA